MSAKYYAVAWSCFLTILPYLVRAVGDANKAEFHALCTVYNLAVTNLPSKPLEASVTDARKLVEEMTVIALALSPESLMAKSASELAEYLGTSPEEASKYKSIVLKNASDLTPEEQSRYAKVKVLRQSRETRIQSAQVRGLLKKAKNLLGEIEKQDTSDLERQAGLALKHTLYGEDQAEEDKSRGGKTYATSQAAACATNDGASAGISLASDLVCLCAPAGAHHSVTGVECDSGLFGSAGLTNSNHNYGSTAAASAAFKVIAGNCAKIPNKPDLKPDTMDAAAADFVNLIAKTSGSAGEHVFGTKGSTCAAAAATDLCVSYKKASQKGGYTKGIAWLRNFLRARNDLRELASVEATVKQHSLQIKGLNFQAWVAYDHAAEETAQEVDKTNPTQPDQTQGRKLAPNPQTDKATAQETSVVSFAVTIPRFILPWTLLI